MCVRVRIVSYVLVVEASNDRATRATNETKEAFEKIEVLQSREDKLSKLVVSTKKALSRKGKKVQSRGDPEKGKKC